MRSMRLFLKKGRKKRGEENKKEEKNERKREKGHATILLSHLCFRVAPCTLYRGFS
jgi:hypothetical protein